MDFADSSDPDLDQIPDTQTSAIPVIRRLIDVPEKSLTWVWPGWIPNGMLTILGGHVGDGKSTLVAALIGVLTSGGSLPDGTSVPPLNVLMLSAQDDAASVIRPRLVANGADLDRVFILDGLRDSLKPGCAPGPFELRHVSDQLRDIISAHDIRLVVIDPLSSFLRRSDRASEGTIRDALHPLMTVIAETGVACLAVMRMGKAGPGGRPAQRLIGSSAVAAIARSVIMLARVSDPECDSDGSGPDRAVIQLIKGNYARQPQTLAAGFRDNGEVRWFGPTESGVDDLARESSSALPSRVDRADCVEFLREYLADRDCSAAGVLAQAKKLGFTDITIRRAKKEAGVTSYRDARNYATWTWHLPRTDEEPALDPHQRV